MTSNNRILDASGVHCSFFFFTLNIHKVAQLDTTELLNRTDHGIAFEGVLFLFNNKQCHNEHSFHISLYTQYELLVTELPIQKTDEFYLALHQICLSKKDGPNYSTPHFNTWK